MTERTFRAFSLALLATTAMATPAFAQTDTTQPTGADQPAPPAGPRPVQTAQASAEEGDEIIVTAQKREENLQDVPISVQAIGTRRLDQLNISNFEDFSKQLPSVSFQSSAPGSTTVYMRGVASGGDGNHSGSLPTVGVYLDAAEPDVAHVEHHQAADVVERHPVDAGVLGPDVAEGTRQAVKAWGLELCAREPKWYSNTVSAIMVPPDRYMA